MKSANNIELMVGQEVIYNLSGNLARGVITGLIRARAGYVKGYIIEVIEDSIVVDKTHKSKVFNNYGIYVLKERL